VLFTALTLALGFVVLTTTLAAPQLRLAGNAAEGHNVRVGSVGDTIDATEQTIPAAAAAAPAAPAQQAPALQSPATIAMAPPYVAETGDEPYDLGSLWEQTKDKTVANRSHATSGEAQVDGTFDLDILSSVYPYKVVPAAGLPWNDTVNPKEGKDRIVVPGSHGFYNFTVVAAEDAAYKFDILLSDNFVFEVDGKTIDLTGKGWADIPMRYRLWDVTSGTLLTAVPPPAVAKPGEANMAAGTDDWTGVDVNGLKNLVDGAELDEGDSCEYRLDWKWPYVTQKAVGNADPEDTALGEQVYANAAKDKWDGIPYYRLKLSLVMWAGEVRGAVTVRVIFDKNCTDSTVTPPADRVYDVVPGLTFGTLPIPTRAGFAFLGWTSDAAGTQPYIQATTLIPAAPNGEITIYAQWQRVEDGKVLVIFNPNGDGGTVTPANKEYAVGAQYGVLPVPTRPGYKFLGWTYDAAGTLPYVKSTDVIPVQSGSVTVYAKWEKEEEPIDLPWWIWILPPAIAAPLIPLIGAMALLPAVPVVLGGLGLGGLGLLGLGGLDDFCWMCLRPCGECACEGKCGNPLCKCETDDTDDTNKQEKPPKTGDSPAAMWSALALLAVSGGLALYLNRKRREEDN
jgi:uncharacterized repeat protein (TIGR02543 family)/LPXTG-motif cell wall-anchored protein